MWCECRSRSVNNLWLLHHLQVNATCSMLTLVHLALVRRPVQVRPASSTQHALRPLLQLAHISLRLHSRCMLALQDPVLGVVIGLLGLLALPTMHVWGNLFCLLAVSTTARSGRPALPYRHKSERRSLRARAVVLSWSESLVGDRHPLLLCRVCCHSRAAPLCPCVEGAGLGAALLHRALRLQVSYTFRPRRPTPSNP